MEELLSLKWNNHRSTFIHVLGVLRDKQLYTDATLACDGKFYNVHRLVMSTCSDYFSAIFDKTACKNPVIVLKDIKSEDLEALLDYMYLGEVNVRQSDLASLIKSAECLRIKGLAVPDDEPPKKPIVNRDNTQIKKDILSSPPSKRRRRDDADDGRDDVRPSSTNARHSSPIRPKSPLHQRHHSPATKTSIDGSLDSPSISQDNSQSVHVDSKYKEPPDPGDLATTVKVEMDDPANDDVPDAETYDLTNDGYKEENDDGADLSNDLPEFLQSGGADQLQGSSFPPDSFPGPSAYQPGDLASWQGDNSNLGFPAHLSNYSSSDTSSQQNNPGDLTDNEDVGQLNYYNPTGMGRSAGDRSCKICGKTFPVPAKLQEHIRIHTGEKPFSCLYCPYRASQRGNVRKHMFTVHHVTTTVPGKDAKQPTS